MRLSIKNRPSFCRILAMCLPVSLMVAGSSASAQTTADQSRIDIVQPGDHRLSCSELHAQIAAIEQVRADAAARASGQKSDSAAGSAVGLGTSLAGIPLVGSLFQMGVSQRAFDRNDAAQRADDASRRKDHLVQLFNSKNCS